MTTKLPSVVRRLPSFRRFTSSNVPRTLTELESLTGKLTYRNEKQELCNYLLINKLMLMHSIRSLLYQKPVIRDNQEVYLDLIENSKYFNDRAYLYKTFQNVDLNRIENFPNKSIVENENKLTDTTELQDIFKQYSIESTFEERQELIMKVVQYLRDMQVRPSYKLHEVLIEQFNRVGMSSTSNQIYDSITRFSGEFSSFSNSSNYLCEVNEKLLQLLLKFVAQQAYPVDYRALTDLMNINGFSVLQEQESASLLNPSTRLDVRSETSRHKNQDLPVLIRRFFPSIVGQEIYHKNGLGKVEDLNVRAASDETMYLYLEAAYKLNQFNSFHLLLRRWLFNSVITGERRLQIIVSGTIEKRLKSFSNLQTVEDYALVFNKKLLKLILRYCYTTKDLRCFQWIFTIIKKVFIVNQHLFLKYTFPLEVIDNEIVSLIWLNCKNLDHEVYRTWVLLERIFKLEDIFEDYKMESFIALNCK